VGLDRIAQMDVHVDEPGATTNRGVDRGRRGFDPASDFAIRPRQRMSTPRPSRPGVDQAAVADEDVHGISVFLSG
jgi:hypothetical protein